MTTFKFAEIRVPEDGRDRIRIYFYCVRHQDNPCSVSEVPRELERRFMKEFGALKLTSTPIERA